MYDYSYEDREKNKRQNINKNAAEKVLQRYGLFLEDYGLQLLRIQKSINESFNIFESPVALKLKPKENTSVLELIDTDNKVLNKILIVFTTLCLEVDSLETEGKQKYLNEILYYGEGYEFCSTQEEPQLLISRLLPILQDVIGFIKRCNQVLVHIVQQIAAFYTFSSENPKIFSAADVHLQEVFEHIGKLLTLIITFDEVINSHVTIKDHFSIYQDTVQAAIQDTDKFNMDVNKLINLDKMLMDIEKNLLRGKLFYNSLHLPFEKRIPIKKHAVLADEFSLYIKTSCSRLEMNILANKDVMSSWLKTCATYVLSIYLFGSTDKKLFKYVWEISKKIPCVTIYGSIMWFPDKFLQQYLGHLTKQIVDIKTQEAVDSSRTSFVSQSVQTLTKKVQMFSFQMFSWTVQIEVCLQQDLCNFKSEDMKIMCNLLCEGVQLSSKMQCFLNTLTNLHGALGKPMTKSCVIILCKLVENVKAMQYMYSRHSVVIAKAVHHMIQRFTYQALSIIATVKVCFNLNLLETFGMIKFLILIISLYVHSFGRQKFHKNIINFFKIFK
uniref:WASH complex subunit 4 N-terminal domain-containing protein n=1 Tax=Clastoptera arizonana TaxID=38151 RepID=A0A1B6CFX9_9HEMI